MASKMDRTVTKKNILLSLFLLYIVILAIYKIVIFLKVDFCLDSGGAWDYHKSMCSNDENSSIKELQCLSNRGTYDNVTNKCLSGYQNEVY